LNFNATSAATEINQRLIRAGETIARVVDFHQIAKHAGETMSDVWGETFTALREAFERQKNRTLSADEIKIAEAFYATGYAARFAGLPLGPAAAPAADSDKRDKVSAFISALSKAAGVELKKGQYMGGGRLTVEFSAPLGVADRDQVVSRISGLIADANQRVVAETGLGGSVIAFAAPKSSPLMQVQTYEHHLDRLIAALDDAAGAPVPTRSEDDYYHDPKPGWHGFGSVRNG
jgi:hypothetical protein